MLSSVKNNLHSFINKEKHIAPLAVLRIAFGAIMLISTVRFLLKGWVFDFYVKPRFFFTYYGFGWVKPFGETGMYMVFVLMALAALLLMIGLFYRLASISFFILFTYVELLDKTYYLNHYYLVTLLSFLMIIVPAGEYFAVDTKLNPGKRITTVPAWTINIFKLQICIVYFYAGISKLNYDWMIDAMPLKIWLPAYSSMPIVGPVFTQSWLPYLFCWAGAIFDLSIPFLLLNNKTRFQAYTVAVIFHILTAVLFPIGMFPYIMLLVTIIFFSEAFHIKLLSMPGAKNGLNLPLKKQVLSKAKKQSIYGILALYFVIQLLVPFRFMLYPGKLFWTEEGYRFSWRVMLMEKGGTAFFYVTDPKTGFKSEVPALRYLTPMQERMMVTQPDMILQYAHFLEGKFVEKGVEYPTVTVEDYVTLNGSGSQLFIDPNTDLSKQTETFAHKKWILEFK